MYADRLPRTPELCECRLWLVVLENSQGEEPFISQASAITEAYSHRHNHLLKLLEIGSPKRYGLGVHHSIQGNLCRCHSSKIIFSVFVPGGKYLPFYSHWAEHLENIFFIASVMQFILKSLIKWKHPAIVFTLFCLCQITYFTWKCQHK